MSLLTMSRSRPCNSTSPTCIGRSSRKPVSTSSTCSWSEQPRSRSRPTPLAKPKGTIGHHVAVLEQTGLIRVVPTEMVRVIEAKYYGRTARTYLIGDKTVAGFDVAPDHFLRTAATEFPAAKTDAAVSPPSTLRHARIPDERAAEWAERLEDLAQGFLAEAREGETTYGLLVAMYPTRRPHLLDIRAGS